MAWFDLARERKKRWLEEKGVDESTQREGGEMGGRIKQVMETEGRGEETREYQMLGKEETR